MKPGAGLKYLFHLIVLGALLLPRAEAQNLYVANSGGNSILEYETNGYGINFAPLPGFPTGMAFDNYGNLFVATGGYVMKVNASGQSSVFAATGVSIGTHGMAFDANGNLYVANTVGAYANTIEVFTPGGQASVFANNSTGLLDCPLGLAWYNGYLYVANECANTIVKYNSSGQGSTFASTGLNAPTGLAFYNGNLYVANSGNNTIDVFNASGQGSLFANTGLSDPIGLTFLGTNLYAVNFTGSTIEQFNLSGQGTLFANASSGLYDPEFITSGPPANVPPNNPSGPQNLSVISGQSAAFAVGVFGSTPLAYQWQKNGVNLASGTNLSGASGSNLVLQAATAQDIGNYQVIITNAFGSVTSSVATLSVILLPLGATNLLEGPGGGSDSVVVPDYSWTATTNVSWLHLTSGFQSGSAPTNVVFSFDYNPGPTRTGTLTIAGQTVTVTQAGSTYVQAPSGAVTTLVPPGNQDLTALTVDHSGNIYFCDYIGKQLEEWTPTNNNVSILANSGVSAVGLALDAAGNVYIADYASNAIEKWTAATGNVSTVVPNLNQPYGVAVDGVGNIYIADTYNNATEEWLVASNSLTTLISSTYPEAVALDVAGNVYVGNRFSTVQEWSATTKTVSTLVSGLNFANDVAVDGSGNVYIADFFNNAVREWSPANNALITLASSGVVYPFRVAVDGAGNVFFIDQSGIRELPHAFVDPTPKIEPLSGGSDSLPVVLPATENLLTPFVPTSDSPWLTITGVTNGVVSFSFTAGTNRVAHINLLGEAIPVIQPTYTLGTTNLVEGSGGGYDSVLVVATSMAPWTITANASWLSGSYIGSASGNAISRLVTSTIGSGSGNAIFYFAPNPGPARTGTITIAGQTLTITQAGSTYVQAPGPVTALAPGLAQPFGTAVDHFGNCYFVNGNNLLQKWIATSNTVGTLVSSLNGPSAPAVDASGNVYLGNQSDDTLKVWTATNNTLSTVVSLPGIPTAVAVDTAGNVYIAEPYSQMIQEWVAASNTLITLVSSGLNYPEGVGVDAIGNVYIADTDNNAVKEWSAANHSVTTLVASGLSQPWAVAVDGSGNVYIADNGDNSIKEWLAVTHTVATLATGLNFPTGVACDLTGNVYFTDSHNNAVKERPRAFIDPTAKIETFRAGSDSLSPVLPANENLMPPFNPTSDQLWLTLTGVTNDGVSFSFTAGTNRVAHINLLGEAIPVIQPTYTLGTTNLLEGPGAGYDSVIVAVTSVAPWTATANASWLNVIGYLGEQGAVAAGSQLAYFSIAANPGPTRTGTLTIAGQTLTVTQAGSNYVQAPGPVTGLITSGLNYPVSVAVDEAGDVYVASLQNNAITKWTAANDSVANVVSSGLKYPWGVAVDPYGNLYISDNNNQAIKEWVAASNTVITLVTGLNYPAGVAVDAAGNVYFADTHNYAIKEWIAASNTVTTIFSTGSSVPAGVAVDAAGNVYFSANNNTIEELNPGNNTASSLVTSGLNQPSCLAVDGSGNVYIADTLNNAVKKWSAVNGQVTTLAASGLNEPSGVAVDATGNVYFTELGNNLLEELPRAFVDPTSKTEVFGAGSDFLPPVLPANENLLPPFTPASDQFWLTVNGTSGGVVNFSFTLANTNRIAHLSVLGQSVPVSQVINVYNGSITNSQFQFGFTNYIPNAAYNVLSATNLTTPLANWIEVDAAFNLPTGYFQFSIPLNATNPARFYRLHLIQ